MHLWQKREPKRIYLDHAASTPATPAALRAYHTASALFGNPSSPHEEGRQARAALEEARTCIARLAEVKTDAVIFTSGATEANALGIRGHLLALHEGGASYGDIHVLYLATAHSSLTRTVEELTQLGVTVEPLALTEGELALPAIEKQIRKETVLIALEVVCGETGMIYPIRDVRRLLDRQNRADIRIFADASQAPRVHSYALTHLGADMVVLDAQKVGGVRGIGALIAPRAVPLRALLHGGAQERGLRPGTENPALASAFAKALTAAANERVSFVERATKDRDTFITTLKEMLPPFVLHEGKEQAAHIVSMSLLGRDTDYLVALLSEAGFAVSTKSACESNEAGSRVIQIKTGDSALAASTLRISWSPSTSTSELMKCAEALKKAVSFLDAGTA